MTTHHPSAADLKTWDDFDEGATYALDTFVIDANAMTAFHNAFASGHDGQPSPVFLTARLMRSVTDGYLARAAGLGAGGVPDVDWPDPAPIGERLTAVMMCEKKRTLSSKPGVGLTVLRYEVSSDSGACVIRWRANQFLRLRSAVSEQTEFNGPALSERPSSTLTLPPGAVALGAHAFDQNEIVAFANNYDPQPFHLDEIAARTSLFGALCASGWHTTAIWYRLLIDHDRRAIAFSHYGKSADASNTQRPPTGFRDVRWHRPVYVGDTITFAELPVARTGQVSQRKFVGLNQANEKVFEITSCYESSAD